MANNTFLQFAIFDWVAPIFDRLGFNSDENVTWRNENAVRPDMTHWIAMGIIKETKVNNEVRNQTNANDGDLLDQVILKRSVGTLRINVFGDDAVRILGLFSQMLMMVQNIETANRLGIGYVGASDIQDLSELISGEFKTRAMIEISFNYTDKIGDSHDVPIAPIIPSMPTVDPIDTTVGTIGQVSIDGKNDKGEQIIDTTIVEP